MTCLVLRITLLLVFVLKNSIWPSFFYMNIDHKLRCLYYVKYGKAPLFGKFQLQIRIEKFAKNDLLGTPDYPFSCICAEKPHMDKFLLYEY